MKDVTCVILAGGQSRRMGENKALVMLDDKPLITHVIDRLRSLDWAEMVIVSREPATYANFGVRIIEDEGTGHGPMNGLYSALTHCHTLYVFLVGCDMPFVDPAWVRWIYEKRADYDAVVPCFDGFPQSLHALYHRRCSIALAVALEQNRYRMENFLKTQHTLFIDETECQAKDLSGTTFFNINTPEELSHAHAMLTHLRDK